MKFGRFIRRGKVGKETGSVFRGMFTLALGSGAARLISIAVIPVLSRIYAPEDYGVLSVFIALTAILAPLLSLRYVTALPLPRHPGLAMSLVALCVGLMALNVVIISLALWAFGPFLLGLFSMERIAPYWWLIALCLLGTAAYEIMTMWGTRRRAYRHIAQTQFTQSLLGALAKVGLGLLGAKPMGLLIGQTIGVSAGTGSLLIRFREEFRENARFITPRNIAWMAGGYRTFPIYRLPSQFLLVFSMQSPMLFTAAMFDATTTGQLGMAVTTLTMPMSLIGTAAGQAFYSEIAALGKNNSKKIYQITKSVQLRLFSISLPISIIIMVFGESAFKLLFGEEWRDAGMYAATLAPYIMFQLTSAPLMNVLNVYSQQGVFLFINICRASFLVVLFLVVNYAELNSYPFVVSYSFVMTAFYIGISSYVILLLKRISRQSPASEGVS